MPRKKAQIFFIELGLAVLLFTGVMALYYRYVSNASVSDAGNLNDLLANAKDTSSSLISPGYPYDWNTRNVERIGLTNNDNRINESKIGNFLNLSYETTRFLLATPYEYYVYFVNQNGEPVMLPNSTAEGMGKPGVNSTNILAQEDLESMVKIERVVILFSDIAKMVVYVWKT